MSLFKTVEKCRVCEGRLESVLDLGTQALGGQFPVIGEPDPPRAPVHLFRCVGCGLAQLGHTVAPELMFKSYGYRSSVSGTMRKHLKALADEAWKMLPDINKDWEVLSDRQLRVRVLDIGGNDGTLLSAVPVKSDNKFLIDPSDVSFYDEGNRINGFFPQDMPPDWDKFDLIFTVACFYDADDPVAFAKAVADRLAPDGLWCVEVADAQKMVLEGGFDAICHEHLCYYEAGMFDEVCRRAGLAVIRREKNSCNGGSVRFYAMRSPSADVPPYRGDITLASEWGFFAEAVKRSIEDIDGIIWKNRGQRIHLLGASTKANTWLQALTLESAHTIQYASDRDLRKNGKWTPGTHIPIISEEESRWLRPDVYLVGPWSFRTELIDRERDFLERGGKLVFPLPRLEVVEK